MSITSINPYMLTSEDNVLDHIVRTIISEIWTSTIVKVVSIDGDTLTVLPLVQQIDNENNAIEAQPIKNVPYMRIQGGINAVIIDPLPGDLGICLFAMRDISVVKNEKKEVPPGSYRQYSPADAMYIGGILNGTPQQFIKISNTGLEITATGNIILTAPNINVNGDVTVNGNITAHDTIINGISSKTHVHNAPSEGGRTSPPEA